MEILEIISESGVFVGIGVLIGFVLKHSLTISKIRKLKTENKKLLFEIDEARTKSKREHQEWEEKNTVFVNAYCEIDKAIKTSTLDKDQLKRLDEDSTFEARVVVENTGNNEIRIEDVRFLGHELFVDGGYGAHKQELEKIDKLLLPNGTIKLPPNEDKTFSFKYRIGKRFNDRMKIDIIVVARVGINSPTVKTFSKELVYIY